MFPVHAQCASNSPSTRGLVIKSGLKAGAIASNHGLKVRSKVKGGKIATNHGARVRG